MLHACNLSLSLFVVDTQPSPSNPSPLRGKGLSCLSARLAVVATYSEVLLCVARLFIKEHDRRKNAPLLRGTKTIHIFRPSCSSKMLNKTQKAGHIWHHARMRSVIGCNEANFTI